jgi:hypothetical protein
MPGAPAVELEAVDAAGTTLWEGRVSVPGDLALPAVATHLRAADAIGRRAELGLAGTGPWSWTIELR